MTCPECGGVLSEINDSAPIRFRCQVGHAFTGKALLERQEGLVDEAMRVALRIIEERAALVARMGRESGQAGRSSMAEMYDRRAEEYQEHAEILRKAILTSMDLDEHQDLPEGAANAKSMRLLAGDEGL